MKTQAISSQQNFNGNLYYVTKGGMQSEKIDKFLPNVDIRDIEAVKSVIFEKPFDLFVSKAINPEGFLKFDAGKSLEKVQSAMHEKFVRSTYSLITKPERFIESSCNAIKDYEQAYKNIQKNENKSLFKSILNLFKKQS